MRITPESSILVRRGACVRVCVCPCVCVYVCMYVCRALFVSFTFLQALVQVFWNNTVSLRISVCFGIGVVVGIKVGYS